MCVNYISIKLEKKDTRQFSFNLKELVGSQIGPVHRRQGETEEKREITPDQKVAYLISKGTYFQGSLWAAADKYISAHTNQDLKSLCRGLNGVWSCTIQMFSTTHYSVKAASLKQIPLWEWQADIHSKDREGDKELLIS